MEEKAGEKDFRAYLAGDISRETWANPEIIF
jgi:hypothetical protein